MINLSQIINYAADRDLYCSVFKLAAYIIYHAITCHLTNQLGLSKGQLKCNCHFLRPLPHRATDILVSNFVICNQLKKKNYTPRTRAQNIMKVINTNNLFISWCEKRKLNKLGLMGASLLPANRVIIIKKAKKNNNRYIIM